MSGLHGKRQKTSKVRLPSPAEGLALAAGCAMQWARLRDAGNPHFFRDVADEVKRAKGTQSQWSHEEMVNFFHENVMNSIGQAGLQRYLQRSFLGATKERRTELQWQFVEAVVFKYLATQNAGADFDAASELAAEACLDTILKCKELGGKPDWSSANLITEDVWEQLGSQAGLKEVARKFMTLVCAGAQEKRPINPICGTCGELKYMHKGDRLVLVLVDCKCVLAEAPETVPARKPKEEEPAAARTSAKQRTRGFNDDLDPTMHGTYETYERKCKQLDARFPNLSPKEIVKKLLGRAAAEMEADSDDDAPPRCAAVGVTGEQGGRLLTCLLVRATQLDDPPPFLSDGVLAFLNKQLPKTAMFPAAKLCIEKAIKFHPKLERCLDHQAAARAPGATAGPDLDFGSDDGY